MNCALTRILVIAAGTGMLVAWLAGSDPLGWVAAAVAGLVMVGVERRAVRRGTASCAVPMVERERLDV